MGFFKGLDPTKFPIDTSVSFHPDKIFLLQSALGLNTETRVIDCSETEAPDGLAYPLPEDFRAQVEAFAQKNKDKARPVYVLKRKAWYSMDLAFADQDGNRLASLSGSLFKLGTRTVTFPEGSPHSAHDIESQLIAPGRSEEVFVKDSNPFFWDMVESKGALYKLVDEKRVLIALFAAKHGYTKDWVLLLNSAELDEVVAIATFMMFLNRVD
ncbi:uncharacterized protein E0L32_009939 [Thyridium curvatum]|uniref:Uncharacterized protein n=1 Tax=Thyridium curvatum TaxID=1093900 RepID=A0A507AWF7_9PEZI|nr:uncharacterized protein E0L32_009939 [Thyridium curvatum]TPX08600.1 hypothetical protein E0L32_009939 [Thyridium curvatum]